MPSPRDDEFIRFAVASGYLTEDQARQAQAALREIEELGGTASAPDWLVKRGLLTERQAGLVHQAIAASKAATLVPRELGGFELLEKIGQGGMGSVFKARQKELNRLVALKVLSPRLARSAEFVQRFLSEARAAGRLNHPNIVAAIDVGEAQGFYYFAMEYVEGETLAKLLAREGPLPEKRALEIAADVARALDHAYQKGLIHRDIKPDNIMVTPDGRVRVTDFGLAKALGEATPDATDAERFLGTPAYVAPEQIRSDPNIDCRADIFSLGVTLFQMLTGELPFKGANPMAVAAAVVAEPLPPLRKLRADLSPATARVVERMTAKDPAHRYATPAELVAALESAAAAPQAPPLRPAATRLPPPRRPSSHAPTYVAIVGIAAVIAAAVALAVHFRSPRRARTSEPSGTPSERLDIPPPPGPQTPVPTTSTPAAAADALLRDLARAVARVNKFEEQNPRDYAAIVAKLRELLDEFPPYRRERLPADGQELIRQTQAKLKGLEDQLARAAEAELRDRSARGEALLAAGKPDEALALLDAFPHALRTDPVHARLQALRAQWRQRALELFDAREAEARQLIAAGKLDEAKALYAPFEHSALPELAARAREAIRTIEHDHANKLTEARRLARDAYAAGAKAILAHLEARDFREARTLADAAAVSPTLAPLREEVKLLQYFVRSVADVWTHAAFGLKKLKPGDTFRLGGIARDVAKVEDDTLYLKAGGGTVAKRLTELRPPEVIELATRYYGGASPQHNARLGLFLLAERDYDGARKRIESAKAGGTDVERELALLERLAPRTCPACKGEKAIACPECAGKGIARVDREECEACKGKGGGRCGWCRGRGRLRCTNCAGTGRITGGMFQCTECGGTGWAKCAHCGGDGFVKCAKCKGTGTITTVVPCAKCRGAKTLPCPNCGGKGLLPPSGLEAPP